MRKYTNPSSLTLCENDNTIRIQGTVPGEVDVFDLNAYNVTVTVERVPIPDGRLFTSNEQCEILYVKKSGQWYCSYNYGHRLATDNPDTWTYCRDITDDHARENFYELRPSSR